MTRFAWLSIAAALRGLSLPVVVPPGIDWDTIAQGMRVDKKRLTQMDDLNKTLASLEIERAALEAVRSGWWSMGPRVQAFEAEFAAWLRENVRPR